MRLIVAAIGRLKAGPERELAERYRDRVAKAGRAVGLRDIEIIEIRESRAQEAAKRVLEESIALANIIPKDAATVLLDPRGEPLDSNAFTARLRAWNDSGRDVAFVIGGPDGLAQSLSESAALHQLVRVMLLEQIYRAVTILSGHPYHRD
jgi:23S rRNA (pseudouridine1915-N3)-methyltransferase